MLYCNDFSSKMHERLSELEEKLFKSEAERKLLEAKFQFMADSYKNEEERRLNNLREKYAEFMEDCKDRSRRNEDILKSLQKVENGANAVFAKTERLKQLRSHYDGYLSRANPLWRHPDVLQLQAPDTTQRSPWIREPRMNMAVTRPALLLPGGGAVMLPVDETGMALPVAPPVESQSAWTPAQADREVRKHRLSESIANAKDAKIISTLGEAGQRMIKELKLIEGSHYSYLMHPPKMHSVQRPVFYQSYHLPVYIPPLYGPTVIAPVESPHAPSSPAPPKTMKNFFVDKKESLKNLRVEEKRNERLEKPKDNFEIECLAADGNYVEEDDANLSDDEVLDVALGRSQSPFRNENPEECTLNENAVSEKYEYQGHHFENVTPVAKKIVVAHQKSIDELKAMLSFEEDVEPPVEPQHYPQEEEMGYLVDEDVPEEFTEQNYTEPSYDARFQRDVSRNVILEEDEEEEEEKPVVIGEDAWRRTPERISHSTNRIDSRPQYESVKERNDPPKSPQQYAQQFKALNKSPSQANEFVEEPSPARIERQQSRVVVKQLEPEGTRSYENSDDRFSYERSEIQGQSVPSNEFANMSHLDGESNQERDDFIGDNRDTGADADYQNEFAPNYDQQHQEFQDNRHGVYDNQYGESNPAEQFQNYEQTYASGNQEQETVSNYPPGEQMLDYYSEQNENLGPYSEQLAENYQPNNEFYGGEVNQNQYVEQYGTYQNEAEHQREPQFYAEQPEMYAAPEEQEVYKDDSNYPQYGPEPVAENEQPVSSAARSSILNQLLDSESESYQVDPPGSGRDDSDFDFSIGKS